MNPDGTVKSLPDSEDEIFGGYMQQIFSAKDLGIEDGQDWARRCEHWNLLEFDKAGKELARARSIAAQLPQSEDALIPVRFGENVLSMYVRWFNERGYDAPSIASPESLGEEPPDTRQEWTGTKSEFARFVDEEYEAHRAGYKSPRDACIVLFALHKFDFP
jgi:hypothetical protein